MNTERHHLCMAAALMLSVSAGAAFGESLWVKAATLDLRREQGAVYPSVATMKRGAGGDPS